MPWSGGTYTRSDGDSTWRNDRDANVEILASEHDVHDNDLATGINNCLTKDGQNAATADLDIGSNKLTNVANGTNAADAVNKSQLDAVVAVPTGGIIAWPAATLPGSAGDWLECDGSAVSRTTYSALFNVIGTTCGEGDGSTTFNLPDTEGRVIAGLEGSASRLTNGVSGVDGATLGAAGGDQRMQQHSHTYDRFNTGTPSSQLGDDAQNRGRYSTESTSNFGSGGSQNVQPTIVMKWIIKT